MEVENKGTDLVLRSALVSAPQRPSDDQNRLDGTQTPVVVILVEEGQ